MRRWKSRRLQAEAVAAAVAGGGGENARRGSAAHPPPYGTGHGTPVMSVSDSSTAFAARMGPGSLGEGGVCESSVTNCRWAEARWVISAGGWSWGKRTSGAGAARRAYLQVLVCYVARARGGRHVAYARNASCTATFELEDDGGVALALGACEQFLSADGAAAGCDSAGFSNGEATCAEAVAGACARDLLTCACQICLRSCRSASNYCNAGRRCSTSLCKNQWSGWRRSRTARLQLERRCDGVRGRCEIEWRIRTAYLRIGKIRPQSCARRGTASPARLAANICSRRRRICLWRRRSPQGVGRIARRAPGGVLQRWPLEESTAASQTCRFLRR